MKKALLIVGVACAGLIVLGLVGIAIVSTKGRALDRESRQYVDTAITAIVSQWDIEEIQKRRSPEFRAAVKDEDLRKLVQTFRRLGKLQSYNGATGEANISVTTQGGKVITGAYIGSASFDTGPAEIRISVIKHGSQWQILGFQVNSKVVLERTMKGIEAFEKGVAH